MSSRQLRRLQQQREIEQAKLRDQNLILDVDSEEEGEEKEPNTSRPSLFANLAALEGNEDGDDEDDSPDTEPHGDGRHDSEAESALGEPLKKTKKTRRKKKRNKPRQLEKGNPVPGTSSHLTHHGADELDAALLELSLSNAATAPASNLPRDSPNPEYIRFCTLLSINSQHLKVANEMRNLFGRTAVEKHDDAGGQVPRGARRRQRAARQQVDLETALKGHHAPGKGLPELTLRRNIFIQGKEEWPRATTGGLTVTLFGPENHLDGSVEFRVMHDEAYELVQQQFNLFVEMGDPQNLITLLQRNPYHISSLLQVSKVAKNQGDHALSSDLIERALFTFGRAAQSSFANKLSEGKARLDFARPENRELWLAGYQYIKSLVMKGTYRTALEWAKLLLSLNPQDDPYNMMLMIHHLALRAHEFQYLLDFYDVELVKMWYDLTSHSSPSAALAALQLKKAALCRTLLQESIRRYPWLFFQLQQELNLDSPPSIWGILPRTNEETLFTEVYIRQTKDLWNTPEATSLLQEVTHCIIERLDIGKIPIVGRSVKDLDMARFVYLDNTPSLMALVPPELLHRLPNSDSDPLPPDENIFSWDSQRVTFERGAGPRDGEGAFGDHFDPIAALRALIPRWQNELAGNEQGARDPELRQLLETDIEREEAAYVGPDGVRETQVPPSAARRLYEFLFGSRVRGRPVEDESAWQVDTDHETHDQ